MSVFDKLKSIIIQTVSELYSADTIELENIAVELPRDPSHGDLSTNAAMILAQQLKQPPREVADSLKTALSKIDFVSQIEVAGPGFINFTLDQAIWQSSISDIISLDHSYGNSNVGQGELVNIEFVSTNPTGPVHIGHARGAVYGDVLSKVLTKAGFVVTKEYYMNDYGGQVETLARSAFLRYLEFANNEKILIPEGLYPGDYLIPVGKGLFEKYGSKLAEMPEAEYMPIIKGFAVEKMMILIKQDLKDMNIIHDVFYSEKQLHTAVPGKNKSCIDEAVSILDSKGLLYRGTLEVPKGKVPEDWEEREQLLFKSTDYGDDQDRPLQKNNGEWTYFAADVAYMRDKLSRGFKRIIMVLGADHGGYIKRLSAVAKAFDPQVKFDVKICQLVNFVKDGEPVKMSKRAGTFTTLRDVIDEVGKDITRFTMLTRKNDATMDFDLDKVKEQSKDNPVFYVQYAHVRTKSILENAREQMQGAYNSFLEGNYKLALLGSKHEMQIIKLLTAWPKQVEVAALHAEPHRIAIYLHNLASLFHSLWNLGKEEEDYRFLILHNIEFTKARLALAKALQIVISSGLNVLGVEPLDKM